jgi:hypothetical protein
MYELYGKIYNKTQPKHIRVYGEDWYWNDYDGYVTKDSLKTTPDAQCYLMDRYRTFMNLDKEVEILEEEKKIPDKLGVYAYEEGESAYSWSKKEAILKTKINEIIDYLKSKGDE